jgi:DNA-binding response OmpR family regulator
MTREKSKIVIVDDSPLFRTYLKNVLASQYTLELIEIATVRELHSYLSHTDTREIALVLLDLHLPDGNGLEVIQQMKDTPATSNLPVIVISAFLDKASALLAARSGAQDLVVKPFRPEDLLERLDNLFLSARDSGPIYLRDNAAVKDYYRQIEAEVKRARRAGYELTLLLTGIFRAGTLASPLRGDHCRENIAFGDAFLQLVRESLRETDTVCPLSANEALLILPFAGRLGALTVLDNLNHAFEQTLRRTGCSGLDLLTASVTHPEDGSGSREIIAALEEKFKELLVSPRPAAVS